MGGAVSFSYWTADEEIRNKRAKEYQEFAQEFLVNNMYYGVPVRCGKMSHDPSSALWIEIDPKTIEDAHLGKGNIQKASLETVPSAITVNAEGVIKVLFTNIEPAVEYTLTVEDLKNALQYEDPDATASMPIYVPLPEPPRLFKAERNSLKLNWVLPQPPGIAQQIELQYAMVTPQIYKQTKEYLAKLKELLDAGVNMEFLVKKVDRDVFRKVDAEHHGLGACPLEWSTLSTRPYYKLGFLSFTLDKLMPGDCYCFRLRFLNHRAWSAFSHPSRIIETLPAPPSEPSAPICGFVAATSVQLFWVPPFRDNGSPIKQYRLRGKSAGGEYVELFRGQNTSFLATSLYPEFIYSFEVAAVNTAGVSVWSISTTVTTPKSADKPRPRDPDSFEWIMALQFRDAWRELWDPKTEQVFYFNTITGTRQLNKPEALETDVAQNEGDTEEGKSYKASGVGRRIESEAEAERRKDVEFRKKRYRLIRAIHTTTKAKEDAGDTKSIEIRRHNLLLDGFRKINTASAVDIKKRAKFTFTGEPGIDSGGVGKEAFLLMSRQSSIYAKVHRGWMFDPDKKTGALFFCPEGEKEKVNPAASPKLNLAKLTQTLKSKSNRDINTHQESDTDNAQAAIVASRVLDAQTVTEMSNIKAPQFCRFLGRLLGKAVFDRQLVDIPLSKLLLKHMLGQNIGAASIPSAAKDLSIGGSPSKLPPNQSPAKSSHNMGEGKEKDTEAEILTLDILEEMKDLDSELHNSLLWMLENDIANVIYENFVVNVTEAGVTKEVALCPNGENREVTDENKEEYVRLLTQWKTHYAVSALLDPFLAAFHELVSLKNLRDCEIEPHELDLMLNGKPIVDVEELRAYCIYQGGGKVESVDTGSAESGTDVQKGPWGNNHEVVVWLWQALRDLPQNDVRTILCFFTGSARVPLDGYDPPLNITQGVDMETEDLPRAHTCFNQLVLPPYKSYDTLKEKLLFAAKETEGFSLS